MTIASASIASFDDAKTLAREANGCEVSVRVVARVRTYDAATRRGTLGRVDARARRATTKGNNERWTNDVKDFEDDDEEDDDEEDDAMDCDFSAVQERDGANARAGAPRAGTRACVVVGEARYRGEDHGVEIRARIARAVGGLDVRAYELALKTRRAYLGEDERAGDARRGRDAG